MSWVWWVLGACCVVSVVAAVVLGRAISLADRRERSDRRITPRRSVPDDSGDEP
ncbi:hypothetical protein [Rhodococcus rhodnii]|uniref:Uncharacterized protein n=1 Tax=Rhodococcus rhodnii LMG 5362 TaxID=1273125 RepID=R7WSA3_9NOCA|nr:hypothetical protein [Rhodococcus rhodnii]EOM76804.1 hypothetical protein Rrhod_1924 [Rhodococcus rhodnii LMG 5362]